MPGSDHQPVRHGRTAARLRSPAVAVTGAGCPLGAAVLRHLSRAGWIRTVVGVDTTVAAPATGEVAWHGLDPADPRLAQALCGVAAVVHCATDLRPDANRAAQRQRNLRRAQTVLAAAFAAGVRHVVLVSSAMVYGARPDNPVPLPDDAPLRAVPEASVLGDLLEIERAAAANGAAHPTMAVTMLRPAIVLGAGASSALAALFEAPRLLHLRGTRPRWQFCHVDDLASAAEVVVLDRITGPVNVGCDGFLEHAEVEQVRGRRSLDLPERVAVGTAERLHRLGITSAPPTELAYLAHPWVVDSSRLRAAGWQPRYTNAEALRAHLSARPARAENAVHGATAAAGATVALVGTAALVRRARRNRRASS
ncbi:MAG TPA: NAD-dependent epimerase/dehydratase family protein [Mycobacteriales bacterium]|nr:NAD-dependent epimerase/dehydratase family protein [Mycobacteriales bacterium]